MYLGALCIEDTNFKNSPFITSNKRWGTPASLKGAMGVSNTSIVTGIMIDWLAAVCYQKEIHQIMSDTAYQSGINNSE